MYHSKDDIKKEWKRELDECKAFKAEWENNTDFTKAKVWYIRENKER